MQAALFLQPNCHCEESEATKQSEPSRSSIGARLLRCARNHNSVCRRSIWSTYPSLGAHFCHQLLLALGEFLADGVEIHLCRLEFREQLFLFLFNMLLDHFAEDSNFCVVEFIADLHRLDFSDQVFYGRM